MREKQFYTTIVAFSTPSGRLHIGHALGQVTGDVVSKYAELKGQKPFFPFGIHATGKDLLRILEDIRPNKEGYAKKREVYGLTGQITDKILSLNSEAEQVKFLIEHYRESYSSNLRLLGIDIEPRAFFSTDEPTFHAYTQWALRKLNEKGLIIKTISPRPYCPKCGDIKAIESDFSEVSPVGDVNLESVRIQGGNLLFFNNQDTIFPVYTTRPETVFGVTNLFFNPKKEYFEVTVEGKRIISERECLDDLVSSLFGNSKIQSMRLADLNRASVFCSFTNRRIPLVPANFVKSDIGTGIVMSVPLHDPFDYFFLAQQKSELLAQAKVVIFDEKGNPVSFDTKILSESNLEKTREKTYADQEIGLMAQGLGDYSHLRVPFARETLMTDAKAAGLGGELFRLMGGTFFCRTHRDQKITISLSEENSINYGNTLIQEKTVSHLNNLKLFPPKYREELAQILRSRHAKPCERTLEGNIGTPSPFDSTKRIEALSDSNVYMEYYGIAFALRENLLAPENIRDQLLDYLFLGKGEKEKVAKMSKIPLEKMTRIQEVIDSRFPFDLNVTAFEHRDVHFPFSLFTHAAILPERFFPKEYLLTSHITLDGEKMSKSKGNVLHIDDLVDYVKKNPIKGISENSSLDVIRYFLMSYQSLDKDFDWSERKFIESGINRLQRYVDFVVSAISQKAAECGDSESVDNYGGWLSTKLQRTIKDVQSNMEFRRFREAAITIDSLKKNVVQYAGYKNFHSGLISKCVESQLALMYPFTPRISEELGIRLFGRFSKQMPSVSDSLEFPEEHDSTEHEISGNSYLEYLAGALKRSIGIAQGKGFYNRGIKILLPSRYIDSLFEQRQHLRKLLGSKPTSVDKRVRVPSIEHNGVIY